MSEGEYIQIEDDQGVYDCTNSLTGICDEVVINTAQLSVLVKEKHKLFAQAKALSTSLINELHALNKYMQKSSAPKPKTRAKRVVARKVKAKKTVKKVARKKVAKRTVSKRVSSRDSMKSLRANLKKINKALK